MKRIIIIASAIAISMAACKKDHLNGFHPRVAAAADSPIYKITTIAGGASANNNTEIDGIGRQASFIDPWGLTVGENGDIFVADINGNSIRKIIKDSIVTTVAFPASSRGNRIPFGPTELAVSKDGTITFQQVGDFRSSPSLVSFKPNSGTTLINRFGPYDGGFSGLSLDPHFNLVWLCVQATLASGYQIYRVDPPLKQILPSFLQVDFTGLDARFTGITACENDIKYLVTDQSQFYKMSGNKTLSVILSDLHFTYITSLAATKDAKTIYLVDNQSIYKINVDAGTAESVAGPDGSNTNRDGTGKAADVHAFKLALSPDEKSLYFDGDHNVIRKMTLQGL